MKWSQRADRNVVAAVVKVFGKDVNDLPYMLESISPQQWERSYYWLDTSGTALYLRWRLKELDLLELLPAPVLARLTQNLADNIDRTASMFREFTQLNQAFQESRIEYCNLKGFTLSPHSCPHPFLRTQLDFDFLVDGAYLARCCEVLSTFGYSVRASTHSVLELKTDSNQLASISNLYKTREQRCVELHFTCTDDPHHRPARDPRLERLHRLQLDELNVPTLSPADQLIGQATHILSHLCGPSTRLAWLFEFANHLSLRFEDQSFLSDVRRGLDRDRNAEIAMGATCLLIKILFGCPIPDLLETGPVQKLPGPIKLWINVYGARAVLADFPGTKLYLLLREQLESGPDDWKKERGKALMPRSRPPRILPLKPNARLGLWIKSELYQLRYELFRLRFHVEQGLAYVIEARRWHQLLKQHEISPTASTNLCSEVVPTL
jgi:Uncharacterised nucleotidyltransferase